MPTVVAPETDDAMTRLFAKAQEASPPSRDKDDTSRISHPSGLFGAMFGPGKGGRNEIKPGFRARPQMGKAMFEDARFDTRHARDVFGTRCGTSAILAGLVSAKTRAWTTLRRH